MAVGEHAHEEHAHEAHGHEAHGHEAHDHEEHGHEEHGHEEHGHGHGGGALGWLRELVAPHSHDPSDSVDAELEASSRGLRALWVSLAGLALTAVVQAVVVAFSGSVALLSDTLHNLGDALTAVPLGIAFWIGRRQPTRRYTYGYGRAEDLAGLAIVVVIAVSAVIAAWESVDRLRHPSEVSALWAVAAAGVVGFLGNEVVARYRIAVGREIGSAALVADGLHARTDGFTSLAVVVGAAGVAVGWRWADPLVGLLITVAILAVLRGAVRDVYRRLMDAVDPALVDLVESTLRATPGVLDVGLVRLRWIGHSLLAECEIVVDASLSVAQGHDLAHEAEHQLLHEVRRLSSAVVHAEPAGAEHESIAHHRTA